ncbi:MAG TPA: trypsin-like peptidase domain-containing protein [Streptosporangiaceae bacterium]|nr:trypsin-like peptidase domain-containing protein [Streptosporangiaceae bacterium]
MIGGGSWVTRDRVVAVIAAFADGREQVGSGYLVSGRLVLTAAHCTWRRKTREAPIRLRVIRASDGAGVDVAELIAEPDLDVAVLCLGSAPWPVDLPAPVFAKVDRIHAGMLQDCQAIGFPLYQRNPDEMLRGTAELHGTIYQTDEAESGKLLMRELLIHPGPVAAPDNPQPHMAPVSPWEGLSGALVFHQGLAIGVVVEHHPRQGDSALRAVTFDTAASWLVIDGVPLYDVQALLGHESYRTTERYAHLAPDAHDKVVQSWARRHDALVTHERKKGRPS